MNDRDASIAEVRQLSRSALTASAATSKSRWVSASTQPGSSARSTTSMPEANRSSPSRCQPVPFARAPTPVPAERDAHTPYTPGRGAAPAWSRIRSASACPSTSRARHRSTRPTSASASAKSGNGPVHTSACRRGEVRAPRPASPRWTTGPRRPGRSGRARSRGCLVDVEQEVLVDVGDERAHVPPARSRDGSGRASRARCGTRRGGGGPSARRPGGRRARTGTRARPARRPGRARSRGTPRRRRRSTVPSKRDLGQRRSGARSRRAGRRCAAGRARPRCPRRRRRPAPRPVRPAGARPGRARSRAPTRAGSARAGRAASSTASLRRSYHEVSTCQGSWSARYIASKSGTVIGAPRTRAASATTAGGSTGPRCGARGSTWVRYASSAVRRARRAASPRATGATSSGTSAGSVQCTVQSRNSATVVGTAHGQHGPGDRAVVGVRVGVPQRRDPVRPVLGDGRPHGRLDPLGVVGQPAVGQVQRGAAGHAERVAGPPQLLAPPAGEVRHPLPDVVEGRLARGQRDDLHVHAGRSQLGQGAAEREGLVVGVRDHDEQPVAGGGAHGVRGQSPVGPRRAAGPTPRRAPGRG